MSDHANLLVELFVEELPPKALKKLGEAFATVLADSLKAQGLARPMRRSRRSRRRGGWRCRSATWRRVAPTSRCRSKLMPVAVALDAIRRSRPRRC
jgi:glycyl-tRNA synthetase beta chain